MAGVINLPEGFDAKRKCPAIVVSYLGGGVKEQTAGVYVRKVAEQGFVTLPYNASCQGESWGGAGRSISARCSAMAGTTSSGTPTPFRCRKPARRRARPSPPAPLTKEEAPNPGLAEAWGYSHTVRCAFPTAPGYATARSLNQIITYDAYHLAEDFLTQPLQIVAGSNWMSDDLFARAASRDTQFHVVDGARTVFTAHPTSAAIRGRLSP